MTTDTSERYAEGWIFVGITFALTWAIWSIPLIASFDIISLDDDIVFLLVIVGTLFPSIVGISLVYYRNNEIPIREFLQKGIQYKFSWNWWLIILFMVPICAIVSHGIVYLWDNSPIPGTDYLIKPWEIIVILLISIIITGPLTEEYGWRGYLQPRFNEKFGVVTASFIIGLIWTSWHIPIFFVEGSPQEKLPFWLFVMTDIELSMIIGWIQYRTDGSLLPALILHGWINATMELFPLLDLETGENWLPWLIANIFLLLVFIVLYIVDKDNLSNFGTN